MCVGSGESDNNFGAITEILWLINSHCAFAWKLNQRGQRLHLGDHGWFLFRNCNLCQTESWLWRFDLTHGNVLASTVNYRQMNRRKNCSLINQVLVYSTELQGLWWSLHCHSRVLWGNLSQQITVESLPLCSRWSTTAWRAWWTSGETSLTLETDANERVVRHSRRFATFTTLESGDSDIRNSIESREHVNDEYTMHWLEFYKPEWEHNTTEASNALKAARKCKMRSSWMLWAFQQPLNSLECSMFQYKNIVAPSFIGQTQDMSARVEVGVPQIQNNDEAEGRCLGTAQM